MEKIEVKEKPCPPTFMRGVARKRRGEQKDLDPPQSACSADSPLLKAGAEVGVKMYLSIGNDMSVRDSSIIGIFDLDNTTINARGREFLERAEKEGQVVPCDDLPKTFVLTAEYGLTRLYLSSLNTSTLEKRMK